MDSKSQRILLIDDDIHLLDMAEKIIEKLGYHVISHTRSKDALEIFRDLPNQFDLVITDFKMPGMNGAELCREILKIKPDIPIIMCSGYASDFDEHDAMNLGIKRFIRKPLMKKDFAVLIQEALNDP